MYLLVGAAILWVVPIFVASSQGHAKNRMGAAYGICLGWIGVLILAVLPPLSDGSYGLCPWCQEDVRVTASVCPHCRREISPIG